MQTHTSKNAHTDSPILDVIANRFSPRAYQPRSVATSDLLSCLEAARWSASSYNEQPWSFIVAQREDESGFAAMLDCLVQANQAWAVNAGVLLISVACKSLARNGGPNRMAQHDIGQAVGFLSLQATALGLQTHQMGGINLTKIRQVYGIPESHEPVTGIALGYPADVELAKRERTPGERKPVSEFVFGGQWQQAADLK